MKALDLIWRDGYRYQKAGIVLNDFFAAGQGKLICLTKLRRGQTRKR